MEAAYKRVYEKLKKRIVQKEYAIGELLPPEPRLEEEFHVSRTTVRRAIDLLAQDGYITVKQGFGTQVVSQKTLQNLNRLTSIGDSLESKGYKIGIRGCYIEMTEAEDEQAQLLAVAPGTSLVCIYRIRLADEVPVAIMRNYIIASYVPGIEKEKTIQHLYQYVRENYGLYYNRSRDIISACNASYEEAQILNVPVKTALLTIRRICSVNNRPVELDMVRIAAEGYELEVYRESPPAESARTDAGANDGGKRRDG